MNAISAPANGSSGLRSARLAMQAPTLAAIANGMRTMTDEEKNLEGKNR